MLQKNRCCFEDSTFDKSERLFKDKMTTWNCDCDDHHDDDHHPRPDCPEMTFAMAYVKNQTLNTRTMKSCADALMAGTLFDELEMPFTGGHRND